MNSSMRSCTSISPPRPACYTITNTSAQSCSLADQFAANGYLTVIPDIWEGDNVPINWEPTSEFNLGQWMSKHGPEKVEPIAEAAIKTMRNDHGVKKLAGAGYCLGAKYVSRFMASSRGLDVGYFAHPSATSAGEIKGITGESVRYKSYSYLRHMVPNLRHMLTVASFGFRRTVVDRCGR